MLCLCLFTDQQSDHDAIKCDESFPVVEDLSKADKYYFSLLIIREEETPAG